MELRPKDLPSHGRLRALMEHPESLSSAEALYFTVQTAGDFVKAVKDKPERYSQWAVLHLSQIVLEAYISLANKSGDEHQLLEQLLSMKDELESCLRVDGTLFRDPLEEESILTQKDLESTSSG
jgi:hypothetical protein